MHDEVKVTVNQRRKPNVHTFYDHTKGRVDIVDLLSIHHSTRVKSKRWPINAFAFIFDTARTNAKSILCENGKSLSNFMFTYELGKALLIPLVQRRYANVTGVRIGQIQKMRRVLGLSLVNRRPAQVDAQHVTKGRCHRCVEGIVGTESYKGDRKKLNNKIQIKCNNCNNFICKVHTKVLCEACAAKE